MEVKQPEPALAVTNLRLKFPGEESLIFKDFSFSVPQGQKVLLLGPSGCGKSTLLQVLSGIIPNSVEIPLKYDHIRRPDSWGFVFQDPDTQFCMPFVDEELAFVLENLSIPRDQMERYMERALSDVGLKLDDLHTPIHMLSQGMKQRLALASVLLLQPEVLFLDEPSALLDPEGTTQIWEAVRHISASKTILIVEHKVDQMADLVDRVVLFNRSGEIIADDTPLTVFREYKDKLIQYGIWYPDVWTDYVDSKAYRTIRQERSAERGLAAPAEGMADPRKPILTLTDFAGYHGQDKKITVKNAAMRQGDWIAVIGENGAGKSTLLLSLMQLLRTTGHYVLDGKPVIFPIERKGWAKITGRPKSSPPEELAFVFQNPELQFITNSIYDEMAYALRLTDWSPGQTDHKVKQLLEMFDLQVNEQRHPYQLSAGQKRRLSVASALVKNQSILLLDEPTFGQDAKNTFAILEMLESLRLQGTTVIMVTHDMNIVQYFSTQSWIIKDGMLADICRTGTSNEMAVPSLESVHTS